MGAWLVMSEQQSDETVVPIIRRQSLALRSGVCDLRIGAGALEHIGQDATSLIGKPRAALLVYGDDAAADTIVRTSRSLIDAGFAVSEYEVPAGRGSRRVEAATQLYSVLADAGVNGDDLIVTVGDADVISMAVFSAATWCGGCALLAVPTTLDGLVDVPVSPRPLDSDLLPDMVQTRGVVRLLSVDTKEFSFIEPSAATRMGLATMVGGAVTAGERSFSELAVRADDLLVGTSQTLIDAVLDITRARASIASSTAVAIRQGMEYGHDIARALRMCLPECDAMSCDDAALYAEGMRISARLAAAHQGPDTDLIDLVYAQDGLLNKFGLTEIACEIDPDELMEALRVTSRRHTNRLMPALPLDYGRVRLTALSDELLLEHLTAWCRSRKKRAQRGVHHEELHTQ